MSFYNEYRPHQFSEVLGQEQVTKILQSQALTGQYHHAYLGTGKSALAFYLLETFSQRYSHTPVVVGFPENKRGHYLKTLK